MIDEVEAIRQCQGGDIAGLELLIAHHQQSALRLAVALTGDHALAEDIVQDSFLIAFRDLKRFQIGRPFAPWFLRIVVNMTHQYRRRRREINFSQLDPVQEGEERAGQFLHIISALDPAMHAEQGEASAAMRLALAALTPKQRETVALRYYFGYSDGEIAEIVSSRVDTVRHRLHDGLRALEKVITQRFPWLLQQEFEDSTPATREEHRNAV